MEKNIKLEGMYFIRSVTKYAYWFALLFCLFCNKSQLSFSMIPFHCKKLRKRVIDFRLKLFFSVSLFPQLLRQSEDRENDVLRIRLGIFTQTFFSDILWVSEKSNPIPPWGGRRSKSHESWTRGTGRWVSPSHVTFTCHHFSVCLL